MRSALFFLALVFAIPQLSVAQSFTGTIEINSYQVENGEETAESGFRMMMNPDRVYIDGIGGIDDLEEFTQTEITYALFRHDYEDIIFYGGGDKAIQIENEQVEALINMMGNLQQQIEEEGDEHQQTGFNETSEQQTIAGYSTTKWIITDADGSEVHLWMSDEITMNWGILTQDWIADLAGYSELPIRQWISEGKTPLLIENYEGGQMKNFIRMDRIAEGEYDSRRLEAPGDKELVNLQQIIMEQFGGQ